MIEVLDDDEPIDVTVGSPPPPKKSKTSGYLGNGNGNSVQPSSINAKAGPSRKPSTARASAAAASTRLEGYRLPRAEAIVNSQEGGAFGSFSYPASSSTPRPTLERTAAQQEQHEKWHRKVVGGSLIPRRRSLALDEAAALEARRQLGLDEGRGSTDGTETPQIEDAEEGSDDERQKAAEKFGNGLAAKYAAKTDVKGKGKAVSRKKKEEEVGPSGQTYTPLEKQYMEIKASNPDVLLMMEGKSVCF